MPRKILVVNNNQAERQALGEILRDDYTVLEAACGQEALSKLRRSPGSVSAVVLDTALPNMDVCEVLSQIRNDPAISSVPVIISIERYNGEIETKAFASGANDFVLKPYNPAVVKQRLWNIIHLIETTESMTEQRLAEETRRERVLSLETIMDNLNSSVSAVTVEDGVVRIIFANDKYYSLLGYTKAQFEAEVENAFDVLHPDDQAPIRRVVEDVIKLRQPASYAYRIIRRDGALRYLQCDASVIALSGVSDTVLLSVITDFTALAEAEQAVARTAEQLSAISNNINGGVTAAIIGERSAQFLFANDQYYAQLGYTREQYEAEVTTAFSPVHPDDREMVIEVSKRASEAREPYTVTYRIIRRDGSIRWIQSNISITSFPGTEEPVQLAVANDITAQVEAEQKLTVSSERLEAIIANIAGGVTATIIDDAGQVEHVLATDKYYELFGYTKAQYTDEVRDIFSLISRDDVGWVVPKILEINRTGKPTAMEFRAIRRDGREIWLHCVISLIRFADIDAPVQLTVFTDITEDRETSAQLSLLTENIPGGIAALKLEAGNIQVIYFNDGFYSFSGYSREEYQSLTKDDPLLLVLPEDIPSVYKAISGIRSVGEKLYCTYRCRTKDGGYRWFDMKGSVIEQRGDALIINVVQFDITERREAEERLRVSEAQFRIAAAIGDRIMARYDIKTGIYYHDDKTLYALGFPSEVEDVPQAFVDAGCIAPECVLEYYAFYGSIKRGDASASMDVSIRMADGKYRWFHTDATALFDEKGRPSQAIIISTDITELRKKEAVYNKWQQSLRQKLPESYTLYRLNLSKDSPFDSVEGSLLQFEFSADASSFDARMQEYAERFVYLEDSENYLAALNSDSLLANYYRGKRTETIEYRETRPEGGFRWLRVTVELVEYPYSADVEAYLMYEDIDESKRSELTARARADADPLTGVLNRTAFAREMDAFIQENKLGQHTLLMMDIDGFKLLNDTFGHVAGDQALIDIADALRSVLRRGDLLGRLGGDEFLICLKNVPYDAIVEKKARQICTLVRKSFSPDVHISVSIGIAVYPRDGESFDALYRNADTALYGVKGSGKDNYAFFSRRGEDAPAESDAADGDAPVRTASQKTKRRMLIVDDSEINRKILTNLFKDEFLIETAGDGKSALVRIRHYGAGISVVLLDLIMPIMDGFSVLEKMRSSPEMRSIPVIVVSEAVEYENNLKAIQCGASDFVTKPVDPSLIRLRVHSAISRAENERLRAQNSYLLLQSSEEAKYRTVLDSTGTVVIEYDWLNGVFSYDASITQYLAGNYDSRRLWHILLSDMVVDVMDIKNMQDLVHNIANSKSRSSGSMTVLMKTPANQKHWFRFNVFKRTDEYQLTDKMILTFNDVNEEMLADEKLRFQAERDALTGLYNRQTFLKKTEEMVCLAPASTYLMTVGDVDNFKMVNDRYGHAEGDRLLKFIADTVQADVERVNGLCGRLGGDGFATLIPNTALAVEKTNAYSKNLLSRYSLALETTISIGYYVIDNPAMSADGMLDRATMAKQTVKGKYEKKVAWYSETMREKLLLEQEIAGSMEAALHDGMFDIYLQPQFNHATGEICGAEALVRWLREDKSVLYLPGEFIPLFERNGFIAKLDAYVWNRTAELFHAWLAAGNPAVPVSVNISRLTTRDPMLCEKLLGTLRKYDIPIELFRLEITESLFDADAERLIAVIGKLHAAGFVVEMDDFGSGYSSLNVLKDVPVDILKLDIRFFSGTVNKERSGMILNAVMRMARWLDMPVIAEGVETQEQADYLTSIGCPIVQGYLYAAPMPVPAFEKLLKDSQLAPLDKSMGLPPSVAADIKSLWAVETTDSLQFYNDTDAAVIYEYHDGIFEALRVNKRFYEIILSRADETLPTTLPTGMHEDDIPRFFAATERAIASGKDETVEVRRIFRDRPDVLSLRCKLSVMPSDAGRAVLLCKVERV